MTDSDNPEFGRVTSFLWIFRPAYSSTTTRSSATLPSIPNSTPMGKNPLSPEVGFHGWKGVSYWKPLQS
jgi:hypothetical protein